MSEEDHKRSFRDRLASLSPERRKLLERKLAQAALHQKLSTSVELQPLPDAVAVIGIGNRFPGGARGPRAFFESLESKKDAVGEVPASRWDPWRWFSEGPVALPGKMNTRWGGFIDDIDKFDAGFFGISPGEADAMDPQQRVLLEVTWEALEDAGLPRAVVSGGVTGVFIGGAAVDYERVITQTVGERLTTPFFASGQSRSVIAGRIAYALDLTGPAMVVEAACASSLLAVHLACNALYSEECDIALAGGVNVMLSPIPTIALAQGGMQSPTGRCHSFDARADGYVRSEGCGVAVLKLLSDAVRDGDRVYAVIRGSAAAQDGRSNGLTAPNGRAQERVIRAALERARVEPAQVQYVETHGTGTALGDLVEASALGRVFAAARTDVPPLAIGALKNSIGHMESAAGIGGLVKAALAIHFRKLAPNLHFETPNPAIPFEELALRVQAEAGPWPSPARPLVAGVSAFGFSGTNVHVVLAEPPPNVGAERPARSPGVRPLALSASDEPSLRALAEGFASAAGAEVPFDGATLDDVSFTSTVRRSHLDERLVVLGQSFAEWADGLRAFVAGAGDSARVMQGVASPISQPTALYVGALAWSPADIRQLVEAEATAADVLQRAGIFASGAFNVALRAMVLGETEVASDIARALSDVAVGCMVVDVLHAYGVRFTRYLGDDLGEIVAGYGARLFTLEDALSLTRARERLARATTGEERARAEAEAPALRAREVGPFTPVGSDDLTVVDSAYWLHPATGVERADASALAGCSTLVTLGSAAQLARSFVETSEAEAEDTAPAVEVLSLLSGASPDTREELTRCLAVLHCRGVALDWSSGGLLRDGVCTLPLYPWHRDRHWVTAPEGGTARRLRDGHPILERFVRSSVHEGESYASGDVSLEALPYLADHVIDGRVLFPAAGFAELAATASRQLHGDARRIERFAIRHPMELVGADARLVQVAIVDDRLRIASSNDGGATWTPHVEASIGAPCVRDGGAAPASQIGDLRRESAEALYDRFSAFKMSYGRRFRPLADLRAGERVATARLELSADLRGERTAYACHPVLIDGALQALAAAIPSNATGSAWVPAEIGTLELGARAAAVARAVARVVEFTDDHLVGEVRLFDEHDQLVGRLDGVRIVRLREQAEAAAPDIAFALTWKPAPPPQASVPTAWLLVGDGAAATALAATLRQRGLRAVLARSGDRYSVDGDAITTRADEGDFARALAHVAGDGGAQPIGVAHLGALDSDDATSWTDVERTLSTTVGATLALVKAILASKRTVRTWSVLRGAHGVERSHVRPEMTAVHGALSAIAVEAPELHLRTVDLDPAGGDDAARIVEALVTPGLAPLAVRGTARFEARVAPISSAEDDRHRVRADRSYVVTGGLGGVGLALARTLVRIGARSLVLVGRSEPSAAASQAVDALRAAGAQVTVARGDVAVDSDLERILDLADLIDGYPLGGVVHCAGALDDATIANQDAARLFGPVLTSKAKSAFALVESTRANALDFIVLVSSIAGVLGSPGQTNYAMANALLDGLAARGQERGLPVFSIAYGPWADVGMARSEKAKLQAESSGLGLLSEADGGWAFEAALRSKTPTLIAMKANQERLAALSPLFGREDEAKIATPAAFEHLRGLAPSRRVGAVEAMLRAEIVRLLRVDPSRVRPGHALAQLGLDSMSVVKLQRRMFEEVGVKLTTGTIFAQPTTTTLAQKIVAELGSLPERPGQAPSASAVPAPVVSAPAAPASSVLAPTAPTAAAPSVAGPAPSVVSVDHALAALGRGARDEEASAQTQIAPQVDGVYEEEDEPAPLSRSGAWLRATATLPELHDGDLEGLELALSNGDAEVLSEVATSAPLDDSIKKKKRV